MVCLKKKGELSCKNNMDGTAVFKNFDRTTNSKEVA